MGDVSLFFFTEGNEGFTDDGGQRSEVRGQRAEDRGQRAEGRRQRTEDSREAEGLHSSAPWIPAGMILSCCTCWLFRHVRGQRLSFYRR